MQSYVTAKIFDLATAPADIQETAELQVLRSSRNDDDVPMLKLWVGPRTTTIEPQAESEALTVTIWEHSLHSWLSQSGATPGDTVFLTWTGAGLGHDAEASHPG